MGRRRGGRDRHKHEPQTRAPFIDRRIGELNVLSDEGLETIEANADRILAETGMEFRDDPEVLTIFRNAGCGVDGDRVRFEPGFCRRTIQATAPAEFVQHARNRANALGRLQRPA